MKSFLFLLFTLAALGLPGSSAPAQDPPDLANHNTKINYALGQDIISTFQQQEMEIDLTAFAAGMRDTLAGKARLTTEQQKAALKELADQLGARVEAKRKIIGLKNIQEGQAFLAANAKKPDVKRMEGIALDGSTVELQYEILKSGAGPSPKKTDIVEVHYVGSFIDGTVFDSSVKRGIPATFGMSDVIPGWVAALQKMKAGDKWRLFIPSKLAYGEFGLPQITPNSTLIYELELLSFYTPDTSATNPPPALMK